MNTRTLPDRRSIVVGALALPATFSVGGLAGCQDRSSVDRQLAFSSLAVAEEELGRLAVAKEWTSGAVWNWGQSLEHGAQRIEFSMRSVPESKSKLFQRTIGSAAFDKAQHELAHAMHLANHFSQFKVAT